jgi:hypothetical protein
MIKKTILVYEGGLFQSLAHRLARDYERVLYFRPWVSSFSHSNDFQMGMGYENIERVHDFWDVVDEVDTFCFPDVCYGDLQMYLREQGKAVFGAGYGEEMELLRWEFKEKMKEVGLPVQPCKRVVGMDALRKELEKEEDKYIKISLLRGIAETWHHINYALSEPKLADMEHELGARSKTQEFIIEDSIPTTAEVGYDGYCVHGKYPRLSQFGIEVKDKSYAAKVVPNTSLDKHVKLVNDKLVPLMKSYGYQGFVSTEIRVSGGKGYLVDMTCRAPSPAGECFQEICGNLGEVIEGAAHGELVEWKPIAQYGVQALLRSDFAEENWLPIDIPKKVRPWVKLYHSTKIEGQEYIVPIDLDMPQIGSVVGIGNTPEEAAKKCLGYCDEIEAYGLVVEKDAMQQAIDDLKKA